MTLLTLFKADVAIYSAKCMKPLVCFLITFPRRYVKVSLSSIAMHKTFSSLLLSIFVPLHVKLQVQLESLCNDIYHG